MNLARDGFEPYICQTLPSNTKKPRIKTSLEKDLIYAKISKYIDKGYIVLTHPTEVDNYIDYFSVPKGEDNIRLVFNGTSCGLNASTWSSKFWLPMSNTLTRLLSYDYQVVDLDLGEMFLNFPIHRSLDRVVGIDLTPFQENIEEKSIMKNKIPKRLIAR